MRVPLRLVVVVSLVALVACSRLVPLAISPGGPFSLRVGGSVAFSLDPLPDGVVWAVDGVAGGNALVGTITAAGVYTAPARVPAGAVVEVRATDAALPSRTAAAMVTITAPGTMYVLEQGVFVYGDMDTVDGNATPDRAFVLDGVPRQYYDMAIAPAVDTAFISVYQPTPMLFRVPSISTADGVVTDFTSFDDGGHEGPSGVVYDPIRDILFVRFVGGLLVYDGASAAPDGKLADREVSGPALGEYVSDFDVRLTLDPARDRLFLSRPDGRVGVFDGASTIDGEALPDREFDVDAPTLDFLWGAAYDAGRDELYLGDQRVGAAVYVIANASTAEGAVAPSRVIGGDTNPLQGPSQLSYDAANDRLAIVLTRGDTRGVAVFDGASTVDGDVAPTRVISGSELPIVYAYGGYLDPTQ